MPIIPYLIVKDARKAQEFYTLALNAKVESTATAPDGMIMNSALTIGDAMIMIMDENPHCGALGPQGSSPVSLYLKVEDVDKAFAQAIAAGAKAGMEPQDMFWGDRWATFTDPFGHSWQVAKTVEQVSPEEAQRRMAGACEEAAAKNKVTAAARS